MQQAKIIIFDFDGTCTIQTERGKNAFLDAFQECFARLLDIQPGMVKKRFEEERSGIRGKPGRYGWETDGKIVAPPTADIFIEARVCAQQILKSLGKNPDRWNVRLDHIYQTAYPACETVLRSELCELFKNLRAAEIPFHVVSDTNPSRIRNRLLDLGEDETWISPLIYGHAQKFLLADEPGHLPAYTRLDGLKRPVYLRRKKYFDILNTVRTNYGVEWGDILVVGDIAELDLIMPVTLGASALLVTGIHTPAHEITWANKHPRARTITYLNEIPL